MAVVVHYPFHTDGLDVLGNGTRYDGNIVTYQDKSCTDGRGFSILLAEPVNGDYTIVFYIFRPGYTADWCEDMGTGKNIGWGTRPANSSNGNVRLAYSQNYGYRNLTLYTNNDSITTLFDSTARTIGRWARYELHRKGKQFIFFLDKELIATVDITSDTLVPLDFLYFFNAGSHQTGGGYISDLKIYDTALCESLASYRVVEHKKDFYGILK